jgi:hypothetical protein
LVAVQKALAIAVIAVIAMLPASRDAEQSRYRDAQFGWTISYPPSMKRKVVDVQGLLSVNGVVISNFDGVGARKSFEFRTFPPDGVGFGFFHAQGGPAPDTTPPEARFPLSPAQFTVSRATEKPVPNPLTLGVIANGTPFIAAVWFGPRSSRASQEAIWYVVRSLRFPPQETGTMSGSHYVLEDASRYPVNSVMRFEGKQMPETSSYVPPFYLIHAPGGFYAIAWKPEFEPKCRMKLDRPRLEFYCAATRGRWDRMGRPIVKLKRPYRRYNNWLDQGQAKIGRDGQVLVGNWRNPGHADEHRFWPPSH